MSRTKKKNSSPKKNAQRGSRKSNIKKKVNPKTAAKDTKSKLNKIKTSAQLPLPESSGSDVVEADSPKAPKKNKKEKPSGSLRERMEERLQGAHFRSK